MGLMGLGVQIKQFFKCLDRSIDCLVWRLPEELHEVTRVSVLEHVPYDVEAVGGSRRSLLFFLFTECAALGSTLQRHICSPNLDVHERSEFWIHVLCQVLYLNCRATKYTSAGSAKNARPLVLGPQILVQPDDFLVLFERRAAQRFGVGLPTKELRDELSELLELEGCIVREKLLVEVELGDVSVLE